MNGGIYPNEEFGYPTIYGTYATSEGKVVATYDMTTLEVYDLEGNHLDKGVCSWG